MNAAAGVHEVAALLAEVFPDGAHLGDPAYLRWLYEESPFGPVIQRDRFDEQGLAAHYALVPISLSLAGQPASGALSLNTAVHERARGGGAFVTLARESIALAQAAGVDIIVGVANANSTPGFERRLEFVNQGQLPVQVLLPTPGRSRMRRAWSDDTSSDDLLTDAAPLFGHASAGLRRVWTPQTLAWRLAAPGLRYGVHRNDELLAITAATAGPAKTTVALILGVFSAGDLSAKALRQLVRSACRLHGAPFALHAGINDRAALRGVPLPQRLRPSPLNLITRSLSGAEVPAPSRFEFIDFDAY